VGDVWVDTAIEQSYYQQIFDSITDYEVIRLDIDGGIRSWPEGARRMSQFSAEEVLGKPVTTLFADEAAARGRIREELRAAIETGRCETEGWRVRKDGSQFWASAVIAPITGADGSSVGFVQVARDVTERQEQEFALRGTEQMLDAITDYAVIRLDHDGIVRSWSPGAHALAQYSAAETTGRHVSMLYTDDDRQTGLPERMMTAAVRDGRYETEGWRVRKDGSRFWANVILSPIRDLGGGVVGFVEVTRDLTERRDQEQLVQRQRDEILELSTPVIQVWDKVLVLPVIGTLDSKRASRLTEGLLERISLDQAEVVIVDVSGVPAIDTDVAQHLLKTVEAARLMGATSILSGVRPETAQAIVHLGIELGTLRSRNTLKDALQLALRLLGTAVVDEQVAVHA